MKYAFFSAANAAALQEARREAAAAVDEERQRLQEHAEQTSATAGYDNAEVVATPAADAEGGEHEDDGSDEDSPAELSEEEYSSDEYEDGGAFLPIEEGPDAQDPRTRVLSVLELEDLFVNSAPDLSSMCWLSDHICSC